MNKKTDSLIADYPLGNFDTESNSSQKTSSTNNSYKKVETFDDDKHNGQFLDLKNFPPANDPHQPIVYKRKKRSKYTASHTADSVNYRSINIFQAASQGSLPLCVLLWGIASAKKVRLMVPDDNGNNPVHHATQAETPEVLTFLMQQSRGVLDEVSNIKLVDSRNLKGETPLLRAMSAGNIPVVRALLDEGSDPFVFDQQGNTIFIVLAKHGFLWCLNYVHQALCELHSEAVALDLLSCLDSEGHSALDWAADNGDVNMLEFLIRKGLNPYHVDAANRTALFWAVKNGRVAAARFLVLCGLNPYQKDAHSQSAMRLAHSHGGNGGRQLVEVLRIYTREMTQMSIKSSINSNDVALDPNTPIRLHTVRKRFGYSSITKESFAIYRKNPSRIVHTLLYGFSVFGIWFVAIYAPFYAWLPFFAIFLYVYKYHVKKAAEKLRKNNRDRSKISVVEDIFSCPEKGLGLYLGMTLVLLTYIFSSISYDDKYLSEDGDDASSKVRHGLNNLLEIGGVTAASSDYTPFWITCFFLVLSFGLWLKIAWIDQDPPGIIKSRDRDFYEVMSQSLASDGPPVHEHYCRTTLVRKPLRSKYCAHVGSVVARMDHYCQWLNNSIGYGNHRTFVLFLLVHLLTVSGVIILIIRALHREIDPSRVCSVLEVLLSRRYFFVSALLVFLIIVLFGLTALTVEQLYNITINVTINERINGSKYSWMVDRDGQRRNKFDRGTVSNTLEFLRFKDYELDYTNVFETWEAFPDITISAAGTGTGTAGLATSSVSVDLHSDVAARPNTNIQGADLSPHRDIAYHSLTPGPDATPTGLVDIDQTHRAIAFHGQQSTRNDAVSPSSLQYFDLEINSTFGHPTTMRHEVESVSDSIESS